MGKTKGRYVQKYRKEWEKNPNFKDWISEVRHNCFRAYCKYCKTELAAKYTDLQNHVATRKHAIASKDLGMGGKQQPIPFKPVDTKVSAIEAALTLYVCVHSATRTIDHLSVLCRNLFPDSMATSQIKLHRTKCSSIISNVLYPHFQKDLLEDVGSAKYSLLLDESTDISVQKFLGIAVIYYSIKHESIISTFLSLSPLENCNADGIVETLKNTLSSFGLDIKNLIGIGTDNASVMTGINNGVYQKLKAELPHLLLIRCMCHSLQLAVSSATSEVLPRNLEFMVSEVYNWFSRSSARQYSYKCLFQAINNGNIPRKLVQVSQTRWLSIEVAVSLILDQWLELKTHFETVRNTEKCYTAELLYSMFTDEINHAYFLFLKPILSQVQTVNKAFEASSSDPTKLLNDLIFLIKSLCNLVTSPASTINPLTKSVENHVYPRAYLGYCFEEKICELLARKKISHDQANGIRHRCINFVVKLIEELKQRLPSNIEALRKVSQLSVSNVLSAVKEDISSLLKEFGLQGDEIEKIIYQYQNIHLVQWTNKSDTVKFWIEVTNYKSASGSNPFKNLANFAMNLLILPWSNAEVERVFSHLNIVKSKLRNRLEVLMINSLLCIKYGLKRNNTCCMKYTLPDDVLRVIGTHECYKHANNALCDSEQDNETWKTNNIEELLNFITEPY